MKLKILSLFVIVLIIISGCVVTKEKYNTDINSLQQEIKSIETFNLDYNKAIRNYDLGDFNGANADYSYNLWSFYYDDEYYYDSITYCQEARELYAESNTNYQDAITYFKEAQKTSKEKYNELIDTYILTAESWIEINWKMYEVCEYFESASRKYNNYLWDAGDIELEEGNKNIREHDSLIIKHNSLISILEMLEEKL